MNTYTMFLSKDELQVLHMALSELNKIEGVTEETLETSNRLTDQIFNGLVDINKSEVLDGWPSSRKPGRFWDKNL